MTSPAQLGRTFSALADPTRRRVIQLLRRPHRAGELAVAAAMSPPAMSRHLRVLRASGLVEEETLDGDARVRVYQLRREPFLELEAWLESVASFWSDKLVAFQEHVERRTKSRPK